MTLLYKYDKLVYCNKLLSRPSKLIKSPYIADIEIFEENELAHCPSLGISGLLNENSEFICSFSDNKNRKSKYTIELIYLPSTKNNYILTNTNPQFGNIIFEQILLNNLIDDYVDYNSYKREVPYNSSRFDFMVEKKNGKKEFIEIKSVVLCDFQENDYPTNIIGWKKKDSGPEISKLDKYEKAAIFPDGYRKNKNVPISTRAIKHLDELINCKNK